MDINKWKEEFEILKKVIESKVLTKDEANKLAEIFYGFGLQYGEEDPTHAENIYDELKEIIHQIYEVLRN